MEGNLYALMSILQGFSKTLFKMKLTLNVARNTCFSFLIQLLLISFCLIQLLLISFILIQLLLSVTWFLFANQIRTSSIFALKNVFQVPVTRGEQGAEKPETRVGHPGSRDLPDRRIASPCTTHRRLPRAGAARALNFWHGEI